MLDSINPASSYYSKRIEHLKILIDSKKLDIRRLHAQRNELNSKGKLIFFKTYFNYVNILNLIMLMILVKELKDELQYLLESNSYVGEVIKVMGRNKVLVKLNPEGKFLVDVSKNIDISKCTTNTR